MSMGQPTVKQRPQERSTHDHGGAKPFRCECGSMLARLVPGGVELKCRRCKRQVVVPLEKKWR
jgi:hypothetical protein